MKISQKLTALAALTSDKAELVVIGRWRYGFLRLCRF